MISEHMDGGLELLKQYKQELLQTLKQCPAGSPRSIVIRESLGELEQLINEHSVQPSQPVTAPKPTTKPVEQPENPRVTKLLERKATIISELGNYPGDSDTSSILQIQLGETERLLNERSRTTVAPQTIMAQHTPSNTHKLKKHDFMNSLKERFGIIVAIIIAIGIAGYYGNNYWQDRKQSQAINKLEIEIGNNNVEYAGKYNAITDWEDSTYYTSDLQNLLINSGRPVLLYASVVDMKLSGRDYYVTLKQGSYPEYYFELKCDEVMFQKLKEVLSDSNHYTRDNKLFSVIARINSISRPEITLEHASDNFTMDGTCINLEFYGKN